MRVALDETRVEPEKNIHGIVQGSLETNLTFLRRLVRNEKVIAGETTTDLIAKSPELTLEPSEDPDLSSALAASLFQILSNQTQSLTVSTTSQWESTARQEGVGLK
jgi:pyruvate carboxylase